MGLQVTATTKLKKKNEKIPKKSEKNMLLAMQNHDNFLISMR